MSNKAKYENIEGLVPLKNNKNKFIGIKENKLFALSQDELADKINVSPLQSFSVNSRPKNLIKFGGLYAESKTISINPTAISISTDNGLKEINIKEKITKSINGLFEEGNNKGCKDDTFIDWKQPILTSSSSNLLRCIQTQGTQLEDAYHLFNGINEDNWTSSTINSEIVIDNIIPIKIDSMILINTNVNNRTKNINISLNNNEIISNYICNSNADAHNYINISNNEEITKITLNTSSTYSDNIVGFNKMLINAKTRYIQQNTVYHAFIIVSEDLSKIDVLLSSLMNPILPNGFKYFVYYDDIKTKNDNIEFVESYGKYLEFNYDNFAMKITNDNNETIEISNTNSQINIPSKLENNKLYVYNIFVKLNGEIYILNNTYYKGLYDFPQNPNEDDIVSIIKNSQIKAYQYKNNNWIEFNDVPLGIIYFYNNKIINYELYPCNNNFYIKNIDNNIWIEEVNYQSNESYKIKHNLYIDNLTDYKCDCRAICIHENNGYKVDEEANLYSHSDTSYLNPSLSNEEIYLYIGQLFAYDNNDNTFKLENNKWKLVFRIWR